MKRIAQILFFVAAFTLTSFAQEVKTTAAQPLSAERAALVSITAEVQSIDLDKREMTLKGPLGNTVTFVVDNRVKRLNEVKVGDHVRADYYISIAAELREPTAEEKETPLVVLQGLARAPADAEPAAGGLHQIKAVTTVEGIDMPTQTVTLKGPRGNYATVQAQDPENLKKLRIGETVVVTYTEALAVKLKKVPSGNKE
jgi:Cu/Ag efflux protein CusF